MDAFAYLRHGDLPFMQFNGLKLRNYFPREIEKLSVVQVTQTKTFDEVGHPVQGGLYDSALGPSSSERCETCMQYEHYCPGHLGHIRLDVPVFNPLFYQFTFNLVKGSCVHCHRFTCKSDGIPAKVLLAQLRCFDLEVPHLAFDVGRAYKDVLDNQNLALTDLEEKRTSDQEQEQIDDLIRQMSGMYIDKDKKEQTMPTKNAVEMRRALLKEFFRDHLFKRRQKCPLCKGKNGVIRNDAARCILLDFSSTVKQKASSKSKIKKDSSKAKLDDWDAEEVIEASSDSENMDDEKKDIEMKDDAAIKFSNVKVSEGTLQQQLESVRSGRCDKLAWRGAEVREHFRMLFKNDGKFLLKIFPMLSDCVDYSAAASGCPLDGLFCEAIIVPPKKFRPIRMFKGQQYEDPQTVNLRRVLEASETLKAIVLVMRGENSAVLNELIASRTSGKTLSAKMHDAYIALQTNVNGIFDEELCKNNKDHIAGIKQILEKKQGLFRMNMMGKRVNYACRSVITPDPYLDIDEIGIPDIFARKLTFTEPVNVFNLQRLRQFVRNGPKNHPGANYVQLPNGKKQVLGDLSEDEKKRRVGLARQLAPADKEQLRYPYMVMRHLLNGDMLVMNRQPSLHKPSMLGHRARVLFGQRALRMNYAPCKAYNADFDGDEMNGHLVQSYQGQTEVREIVNVGSNLLVPKDATPLLGLIQDHVVSGVLLTLRSRFLNKEDFMHLILAAFGYHSSRIDLPPPTIWKPVKLWTGKQVISCIIKNCIPDGKPLINLDGKAKTPLSCWKMPGHNPPDFDMSESHVVFREGELLVGVFDKSHFGATQYGLIHCIFELYGHRVGVKVLSCFSRLFTTYLQLHGFTLGVADILVKKEANEKRKVAVLQSRTIGNEVVCNAFGLPADTSEEELKRVLASAYNNPRGDQINVKMLDFAMKQGISKYNDTINKSCVPEGLIRLFPQNALQMMIQSGAKGSAVNAIQISCALGQIELEGKRMAVTIAGRTLPSFPAFDSSPRAGGFIDQRFLTGINPQELFFHTMAGREGLIDTAVKTSRSGYLQRCIIKHLEGIKVHYDSTVRDHDGSVIQFRYGEDALDVCKSSFMNPKAIGVLCDNLTALEMSCKPEGANDRDFGVEDTEKHYKKIRKYRRKSLKKGMTAKKTYKSVFTEFADEHEGFDKEHLVKMWQELTLEERKEYKQKSYKPPPRPVDEKFNITSTLGALSEKTLDIINEAAGNDDDKLKRALMWKGMACLAEPGENVGLLAAQSIGEPSTQMTLNTFHFAGRGEMNVTLGIPRLREILMTQSKAIATPSAQIAVLFGTPRERIDAIKRQLDRVYMKQVMKSYVLEEKINMSKNENWRRYVLRINILEPKRREVSARHLKNSSVIKTLEGRFIRNVSLAISKKYHEVVQYQQLQHRKLRSGNIAALSEIQKNIDKSVGLMGPDDGQSSDEEADGGREADAAEKRLHQRHLDEADYDGEEDERNQVQGEEEPEAEDVDKDDEKEMENEEDGDEQTERDGSPRKPIQINGNDSAQLDYDNRVKYVLGLSDMITTYNFDRKKSSWCEIVFQLQLRNKSKLDLATIVEREIDHFIVHQTHGIERCIEREETRDGQTVIFLQTQGINLDAFFRHSDVLDVNSVYSNDLNLVLNQYGIEACNRAIVSEMNSVFAVYGIEVSRRHLSLVADYMTFTGEIQAFNRGAMANNASPLQKMTFETTIAFMREALLQGEEDSLNGPSSRIVVGALTRGGTGSFDLLMAPECFEKTSKEHGW